MDINKNRWALVGQQARNTHRNIPKVHSLRDYMLARIMHAAYVLIAQRASVNRCRTTKAARLASRSEPHLDWHGEESLAPSGYCRLIAPVYESNRLVRRILFTS